MDAAQACLSRLAARFSHLATQVRLLRAATEHPEFDLCIEGLDADTLRDHARHLGELIRAEVTNMDRLLDEPEPGDFMQVRGTDMRVGDDSMLYGDMSPRPLTARTQGRNLARQTLRTIAWASVLGLASTSAWSVQDAQAQETRFTEPIPNAVAMVKGTHNGHEVGRWDGELMWDGPNPIQFTATLTRRGWSWDPHMPDELQIQASDSRPRGNSIEAWARGIGASEVLVVIATRPGSASIDIADASRPVNPRRRSRRAETTQDARSADDVNTTDTNRSNRDAPADTQSRGLSERGTGPGRGQSGDDAHDGLGNGRGRANGYGNGSTRPSRIQNKRADLTTEHGGHTPADGGKRNGSAGGTQGASGNIHGSGWLGLIDAPESVAPLVASGLILIDANIMGFGYKMLSRVVRGLGVNALRKALRKDAARIVAHDLAKVRDKLERSPRYRNLAVAEQESIIERARAAMTREYYAKSRTLFADKADTFDKLAKSYASQTGKTSEHIRSLAAENARAYRKMARAAEAEHAQLAPAATGQAKPKLLGPKQSTTVTRNTPGTATGGKRLRKVSGKWLHGTAGNAARIPGQVADALRGRSFRNWDEFRETFWRTIAADESLTTGFAAKNIQRMSTGRAPIAHSTQQVGKLKSYVLHHVKPVQHGGGVYDLDNIVVVTPRYHKEALDPAYHY